GLMLTVLFQSKPNAASERRRASECEPPSARLACSTALLTAQLLLHPFTDQRRLVEPAGCRCVADCLVFVFGKWNAHHVHPTERGTRDLLEFVFEVGQVVVLPESGEFLNGVGRR